MAIRVEHTDEIRLQRLAHDLSPFHGLSTCKVGADGFVPRPDNPSPTPLICTDQFGPAGRVVETHENHAMYSSTTAAMMRNGA